MRVFFSRVFKKQLNSAPQKIQSVFQERLEIFLEDPFCPKLNNHKLQGKFLGSRSINVTGDWRAIYYTIVQNFYFTHLGRHTDLYK